MYQNTITYFKTKLCIQLFPILKVENILVVGCGNGIEAYCLSEHFPQAKVIGIDPFLKEEIQEGNVSLLKLDGTNMPFESNSFDIVYSYHVLEHIPDYNAALAEISRVMTDTGVFLVGTPNRSRLIGYFSGGGSLKETIKWNIIDWGFKIRGKFKNEFGAHAGFTNIELMKILNSHFVLTNEITKSYYQLLYSQKIKLLNILYTLKLSKLLLPAIYFICRKKS